MAFANIEGEQVEIIEPDDWTTRELYNAEKSLGFAFDGSSSGAAMAITLFVSIARVQPEKNPVQLADEVMGMKFKTLIGDDEEEAPPLVETPFGPERQPNGGLPHLDPSESPSLSTS